MRVIIANNIIEKLIKYENEEIAIYTLGQSLMSNTFIENNIVFDEVIMQRCDNSCIYSGDIDKLNTSLFHSVNIISRNPVISKFVYFTDLSDLQGFTTTNSNLSIVDANVNKKALRSDYQRYNKIISPILTGINKLIAVEVEFKGTLRIQIFRNGSSHATEVRTNEDYATFKSSFNIDDNKNDVYEIRFSTLEDAYYEIANINYFAY